MKKITLLILLISSVFTAFSQDVVYNFNADGDIEGWTQSGTTITAAGGILNVAIDSPTNGYQGIRTPDALGLVEANYLTLRIVVENNVLLADGSTPHTTFQIINYDAGSTNVGQAAKTDVTIPAGGYNTIDLIIPANSDNGGTIDRLGLRIKSGSNTLHASSNINLDSATIVSTTPVVSTFSEFVQNPGFEDITGDIAPWAISGNGNAAFSADASVGAQAARVDITGGGNVFLNNGYTLAFNTPQTIAATGDQVTITWDMKSNNTAINVSGKFTLGGATNQNLFSGAKSVAVADVYESFSVTKTLDAQSGNVYNNINSLNFRIQSGSVSDHVIIDNVAISYTINGVTLSVDNNTLESFSVYPNPAKEQITIKGNRDISNITIYDITGKMVLSKGNLVNNTLNVSFLNSGLYLLRMEDEKGSVSTKKLVIE